MFGSGVTEADDRLAYFCGMNRLLLLICVLFLMAADLTAGPGYQVRIDLTTLSNDRLAVVIDVPPIAEDTAVFVFPVTVPGTYEPHDWWRMVHNFRAFASDGRPLPVTRSLDSQFVIARAQELRRVSYQLDDSFDDMDERYQIFQPTGTSFQGDSVFVFNHGGMIGYVEGYQSLPYIMSVERPKELYCSTALMVASREETHDTYVANSYDDLVDGPAIFARPDTASFNVKGVNVQVALIHSQDTALAPIYANRLQKVTEAIGVFLPSMPVDRYAFLLYLWEGDTIEVKHAKNSQGALEHNYSSLYFWRFSLRPAGLEGVAAHEFLHILVPLNVHSREIDEFDFRDPKMSAHLWLYEGVTEYFSDQALLRGGLSNEGRHIRGIKSQGRSLNRLPDDFSMCDFSRNVLDDRNQRIYPLIYQVGPLNALIMDIMLRETSDGEKGLLELVYALMDRYGPRHPFEDDELFSVIGELAGSEMEQYCRTYLENGTPFPFAEYLPKIGLTFQDSTSMDALSYGVLVSKETPENMERIVLEPDHDNPLGVQAGDIAVKINGKTLADHPENIFGQLYFVAKPVELTLTVLRDGKEVELKGKPTTIQRTVRNVIGEVEDLTDEQLRMRNLVFYGNADGPSGNTSRSGE